MRTEIEKKVIAHLAEDLGINAEEITTGMKLTDDLGADSATLIMLVMDMQDEFEIEVDAEKLAGIVTVNDVIDLIEAEKA